MSRTYLTDFTPLSSTSVESRSLAAISNSQLFASTDDALAAAALSRLGGCLIEDHLDDMRCQLTGRRE